MSYEVESRGKKMHMNKNIARLAVTAGLTAALSFGGVMAPVTMAFAEGVPTVAENGSVTIQEDTYKDTTFKGIKVFSAKVTQVKDGEVWSGDKTLSDIEWAGGESGPVKNAVIHAFDEDTKKPDGCPTDDDSAQAWAEFINKHGSEVLEDKNVKAGSVLDKIAAAVEKASISEDPDGWVAANNTGSFNSLATGYWLFVTKNVGPNPGDDNKVNTDTFTSPIFAVVGGSDEILTPKKQVPTVTKAVRDDAQGSTFGTPEKPNKAADSQMDDYVDYRLTGTVAGNINTFSTYKYIFTDKLPESMTPEFESGGKTPAVTVKIGDTEVKTGCYTAKYENDTITVDFTNLKNCTDVDNAPIALNSDSKVTVEYKAKLDSSKVCYHDGSLKEQFSSLLGTAQPNTVKLTYSNNPHDEDATGDTVVHSAYDYTYGIEVSKVGSDKDGDDNLRKLKDVEFTLQEVVDGVAQNEYIDAKGVKHGDAKEATLKTTEEGTINVVGLDEGTYILKEVKPAPGYNNSAKNGVTFIIKRDSNDQLYQTGKSVTPSTDSVIDAASGVVKDGTATASTGKLSFTIVDQKGSNLPLTGLNGVTFTWIAGGAVLCIGVAHLIRSRKQAEESEQE